MQARGIRLPVHLWDTIDREAAALGMPTGELVRRHLQTTFARDVHNRTSRVMDDDIVEIPA